MMLRRVEKKKGTNSVSLVSFSLRIIVCELKLDVVEGEKRKRKEK